MAKLLIVYGTTEGQTRKIARRMAEVVREFGHTAHAVDSALPAPLDGGYGAVLVTGSLHGGKHQPSLKRFVRGNLTALAHLPTAFFSVSLSAAPGGDVAGARRCAEAFLKETGWKPGMVRLVAGALAYSKYGFLKRMMMKRIARRAGGHTDTSRDWEYTDWARLRADVEEFVVCAVPASQDPPVWVPAEAAQPALAGAGGEGDASGSPPWAATAYSGIENHHVRRFAF